MKGLVGDIDWMLTLGAILLGVGVYLLWQAQKASKRDNPFDIKQMFQDENNRTSMSRFFYMVGGLTTTWIVVRAAVNDKLGWEMFAAYIAALVAGKALTEFAKKD